MIFNDEILLVFYISINKFVIKINNIYKFEISLKKKKVNTSKSIVMYSLLFNNFETIHLTKNNLLIGLKIANLYK